MWECCCVVCVCPVVWAGKLGSEVSTAAFSLDCLAATALVGGRAGVGKGSQSPLLPRLFLLIGTTHRSGVKPKFLEQEP